MYDHPLLRLGATIYLFIIKVGNNLQSIFLLYMRIAWGHLLFLAGLHKIQNMEQTIQFFSDLHIILPSFHAYLVAYFEMICGAMLVVGLASRLFAIPLIIIMIGALSTAHINDLSLSDPVSFVRQPPYPYLITAILLLVFGPGKISIDGWLKRRYLEYIKN